LKWGEIEINRGHAGELLPALQACLPELNPAEAGWTGSLVACLQSMLAEPALYLMVRARA
jgi:hypothetical protein